MSKLDLEQLRFEHRFEGRFFVSQIDGPLLKESITSLGFDRVDYENITVQTINFASPNLQIPNGGYIRMRRYLPPSELTTNTFTIDPESQWYLEIKSSTQPKERINIPINKGLELINSCREELYELLGSSKPLLERFSEPLTPISMGKWMRTHYISERFHSRITLDESILFFGFSPGQSSALSMGSFEKIKFEIKGPVGEFAAEKDAIMHHLKDFPDISPAEDSWYEMEVRRRYASTFFSK